MSIAAFGLGKLLWTNYLPGLWNAGMSGRQAMEWLRGQGFQFRTQTFYNYWREVAGYEKGKYWASRQPEDRPPAPNYIIETNRYITWEYTYAFTVRVTDLETGKTEISRRLRGMNELVTISEARAALEEAMRDMEKKYKLKIEVLGFAGAYHRAL